MTHSSTKDIKTASTYINNLLLARGLLRDGKPLDFVRLARSTQRKDQTSVEVSNSDIVAQVINVVHDMILRRDREQVHQESLALTIRTLRADATRTKIDVDRLTTRNTELRRDLSLSHSSTRAAQATVSKVEGSARALREEIARIKVMLGQVRTQCANDVRKRDVEIQRLKTHLVGQQRGSKPGMATASITISLGNSARSSQSEGKDRDTQPDLQDVEYSLRQENNEFLTELAHSLADENDALIAVVKNTIATLRELQGLSHNQQPGTDLDSTLPTSSQQTAQPHTEEPVQVVTTPVNQLCDNLSDMLERLRDLLTNPSFAPIEEVQLREEEIQRLREGWEKMESKWREAVIMVRSWREHMLKGGDTINLEELKLGLGLGEDLTDSDIIAEGLSMLPEESEEASLVDEHNCKDGHYLTTNCEALDNDATDVRGTPTTKSATTGRTTCQREDDDNNTLFNLAVTSTVHYPVLNPTDGNRDKDETSRTQRAQRVSGLDVHGQENGGSVKHPHGIGGVTTSSETATSPPPKSSPVESGIPARRAAQPAAENAKLGSRRKPLTVHEKLEMTALEAQTVSSPLDIPTANKLLARVGSSPLKRTGIVGRPQRGRRRKSTLSPDELENLMLGLGG